MHTQHDVTAQLFGGHVRAHVLRQLSHRTHMRYLELAKPVGSSALSHALRSLIAAGIVVRDGAANYSLNPGFRGTPWLRALLRTMDGAPADTSPSTGSDKGHGLLRPILFGRPGCTKTLLALSGAGGTKAKEVAHRVGIPVPKVRRIAARLRRIGVLVEGEPLALNPAFPAHAQLASLLAECVENVATDIVPYVPPHLAALFRSETFLWATRAMASKPYVKISDLATAGLPGDPYDVMHGLVESGVSRRFPIGKSMAYALNDRMKGLREFRALVGADPGDEPGGDEVAEPFGPVASLILRALTQGARSADEIASAAGLRADVALCAMTRLVKADLLRRTDSPDSILFEIADFPEAANLRAYLSA